MSRIDGGCVIYSSGWMQVYSYAPLYVFANRHIGRWGRGPYMHILEQWAERVREDQLGWGPWPRETGTEPVSQTPNHYDFAIEPIEYITSNELGFMEGNVVKYVSRWRRKAGVEDLKKARHYLDMLINDAKDNPNRYGL